MGFLDDLFGGGSDKIEVTSKTSYPDFITQGGKTATEAATKLAKREYQPYTGMRVAPLTNNQSDAIGSAATSAGAWAPQVGQAKSYIEQSAAQPYTAAPVSTGTWDEGARDQYMNPFIKGALDPTKREIEESYLREDQRMKDMMVSRGAFGGSREAIERTEGMEKLLQSVSDLYAQGYAGAYDRGMAGFQADEGRKLQAGMFNEEGRRAAHALNSDTSYRAGDAMARLASLGSDLTGTDIERLLSTGALEQAQGQQNLNVLYQDFLEQRDWPEHGLDLLIRTIAGVPKETTTTGEQVVPTPSILGQLGGLGLAGYGLFGGK